MPNATQVLVMTAPVPTPTPYALPPGVVMNPFWDQNLLFGIPIWAVGLTALLIFLLTFVGVKWLYRIMKMAPVAGYKDTVNSTDPLATQVWYFGLTGAFAIFCLTLKERVLTYNEDSKLLDKWVITSVDCRGSCGGVPMVMVSPTSELAKDPPAEKAIVELCKEFNRKGFDANGNPLMILIQMADGTTKSVHAFIKNFQDYLFFLPYFENKYPEGYETSVYGYYDPSENQGYTERSSTAEFFGARRERKARKLYMQQKEDKGFLEKNIKFLTVAVICIIIIIVAWQVAVS